VQLSKGQTSKDGELPYYSKNSVEIFHKRPGPWTLKDTGSLYESLEIEDINDTGWKITATSDTASLVLARLKKKNYKETDVFGLNDLIREEFDLATKILFPEIKKIISQQTGLKL
jgi:hypothetical protein